MKKAIFATFALLTLSLTSNAQIIVYEIPFSGLVGLELTSGDICSPPWVGPEEAKQVSVGNQWGCMWTSTGTGVANSISVELKFTINDQFNIPTLLNGTANNGQGASAVSCATSVALAWNVDPTTYVVGGSNTFLADYVGSSQTNQLDHLYTTSSDIYMVVTVDYGACSPPTAVINETTDVSCNGGNDGAIDIGATGGATPYTYDWDNDGTGDFDDTEDLSGLTAGTYTVIVKEDNGCTDTISYTVTEPAAIDVSVTQAAENLSADATGLNYQWIDCAGPTAIPGATNQNYTATTNGDYAVVVTDGLCSDTSICYTVTTLAIPALHSLIQLEVFPNPSTGTFFVKTGSDISWAKISILDMSMKLVHSEQGNFVGGQAYELDLSHLESGIYNIILETSDFGRRNILITIE